jgi:hypothetical protein
MSENFASEWANALGIGSPKLPIKYSDSPESTATVRNWVYYTMYGFESIETLSDLNACFVSLALPLEAVYWQDATEDDKTGCYYITRPTSSYVIADATGFTPPVGKEHRVVILKVTGDIFNTFTFPYTFPIPFVDAYGQSELLRFLVNLLPYYVTPLIKF